MDGPISLVKITEGLHVLQHVYGQRSGTLSAEEQMRLADRADLVGRTDRVQSELNLLTVALELLSRAEQQPAQAPELGSGGALDLHPGLTIYATEDVNEDRKVITDGVVFHAVLQQLRLAELSVADQLLVVAGADNLAGESLEALARQARRQGLSLLYLFEHLRGDLRQLLGGGDSAAVLMRLGNAQEAAAAAEFIGRGHRFVLSQITRGFSETTTVGGGTSRGGSSSSMDWTSTWQESSTWSQAHSPSHASTQTRVYEFTVEPTTIQELPPTAFVMVDTGPEGRRVVVGDCNPANCLLDRVSDHPLPAGARQEPGSNLAGPH